MEVRATLPAPTESAVEDKVRAVLLREWSEEQIRLRDDWLVLRDEHAGWRFTEEGGFEGLKLIAGMDTSFIPKEGEGELAVAVLTVCASCVCIAGAAMVKLI